MNLPFWVTDLSRSFWEAAAYCEPFPRNLRRPMARALPLALVHVPSMRLHNIRDRLLSQGIPWTCPVEDRGLRAFLLVHKEGGLIFLDGDDPDEEQRFSLAHEIAHFLRHYWSPRSRACKQLGESIQEVFDGVRAPTIDERLSALVRNLPIGFHWHFLQRDPNEPAFGSVVVAEEEADLLACELLAPAEEVMARRNNMRQPVSVAALNHLLQEQFGLPASQSSHYAGFFVPDQGGKDPLLSRLRKSFPLVEFRHRKPEL